MLNGFAIAAGLVLAAGPAGAVEVVRGLRRGSGPGTVTDWGSMMRYPPGQGPARPLPAPAAPAPPAAPATRPGVELASALADAGERRLVMRNAHTGETLDLVYFRDGERVEEAMERIARFLRDWRRDAVHPIAPSVVDQLFAIRRLVGTSEPLIALSGYRTRQTNELLRSRSPGLVARDSFHLYGRATDFTIPGVATATLRDIALGFRAGGVGSYLGNGFVHVDDGPVRSWSG